MKRHTCIICGKKRNEDNMKNVFGLSWACSASKDVFHGLYCCDHPDIQIAREIFFSFKRLKKLRISFITSNVLSVLNGQFLESSK